MLVPNCVGFPTPVADISPVAVSKLRFAPVKGGEIEQVGANSAAFPESVAGTSTGRTRPDPKLVPIMNW